MSIVNITLGTERALVGCDTACRYGSPKSGEHGQMSKLMVLQGLGGVMAYRGERKLFERIFMRAIFGREPESFDDLTARMPAIINASSSTQPTDHALDLTLELYVVGWSPQRGRMAGAVYVMDAAGTLTDAQVDTWQCASSPELPEDPSPLLDSHEAMFAHAKRQVAYGNLEHASHAIGGRFFIADITRHRIVVDYAGDL